MEKVIAEVETSRGVVCLREWRDQRQIVGETPLGEKYFTTSPLSPGRSRESFRAIRDMLLAGFPVVSGFRKIEKEGVFFHGYRI